MELHSAGLRVIFTAAFKDYHDGRRNGNGVGKCGISGQRPRYLGISAQLRLERDSFHAVCLGTDCPVC